MTRVLVMGVPWVQERVRSVAEIISHVPDVETVWDRNHDAMDTWRLVLDTAGFDPVVILEDDVELTDDWRTKVEEAVSHHPDHIIQFFSMRKADQTTGSRWEPGRTFSMNQCYYLPARVAHHLLQYSQDWAERFPEHPTGYDLLMGQWMKENKLRYWLHVPSLVQHRNWRSEINPKRSGARQSKTFTKNEES